MFLHPLTSNDEYNNSHKGIPVSFQHSGIHTVILQRVKEYEPLNSRMSLPGRKFNTTIETSLKSVRKRAKKTGSRHGGNNEAAMTYWENSIETREPDIIQPIAT